MNGEEDVIDSVVSELVVHLGDVDHGKLPIRDLLPRRRNEEVAKGRERHWLRVQMAGNSNELREDGNLRKPAVNKPSAETLGVVFVLSAGPHAVYRPFVVYGQDDFQVAPGKGFSVAVVLSGLQAEQSGVGLHDTIDHGLEQEVPINFIMEKDGHDCFLFAKHVYSIKRG